ncbi:hypothetical protein PMAYCL1PPCAC_00806 [Pristionchus mayeri]|uniref:C2H2-type domain-containing protein n=1 Tax=Pristionchus mayeri TaxID=1317129 RepID=A0AAN4Z3J3_9BILA|nr:hypothetical protein PMAYCL1PPCAC_00806 [Pristionchus mayeri]
MEDETEKKEHKCPECEHHSKSAWSWVKHLKIKHSTTPTLVTPQCFLCKKFPETPYGFIPHLKLHHKTTLLPSGIYLLCSCGTRYNSSYDQKKRDKKCSGGNFTLHKLDED